MQFGTTAVTRTKHSTNYTKGKTAHPHKHRVSPLNYEASNNGRRPITLPARIHCTAHRQTYYDFRRDDFPCPLSFDPRAASSLPRFPTAVLPCFFPPLLP